MRITDTVLIVPAYNEAAVIRANMVTALATFPYVVVVDDGSRDDTSAQARAAGAIVLRHPVNLGQGAALQTGIEYSLRLPVDYFVSFDADGQHRIADVLAMREAMLTGDLDIVLGSRFLDNTTKTPLMKKLLLKAAVRLTNLTSGLKLTDTHNGLRLFNRHVAETISLLEPGYQHASEFIDKVGSLHYRYCEMPVTVEYSDYAKAKGQPMLNAINIVADTVASKALDR